MCCARAIKCDGDAFSIPLYTCVDYLNVLILQIHKCGRLTPDPAHY
ncbi:MAG TPA: hypothetical protein VJA20_01750 [Candidatus Nanoarchaeia archaeon]|nr:hypothetical protein [Candidatus Nanoarchaeia archaeon]